MLAPTPPSRLPGAAPAEASRLGSSTRQLASASASAAPITAVRPPRNRALAAWPHAPRKESSATCETVLRAAAGMPPPP